jgi:phytoene dehydrogenase-like protein
MTESHDAVVVGPGINGLACALHLAHKGWRVGVFEAAAEPGGAAKSGAYTLPGLTHDWAAMNLSLFAGSAFFRKHGKMLEHHGLAFAAAADCFASVFPGGRRLGVSTDIAATRARLAAISPADAAAWGRLARAFPGEAATLFALLGSPMSMRALACFMLKTLRARGLRAAST